MIKVVWGDDWDALIENDDKGLLVQRMGEVVDGQYQKHTVSDGAFIREDFFGKNSDLLDMVAHLSDDQIEKMRRGDHDPEKVYTAYKGATEHKGAPTVILAKTVKGYGMGEAGEGKNITHQQKSLNENELRSFRTRFGIPISDDEVAAAPFYRPDENSPEMHIRERRAALGGSVPSRSTKSDLSRCLQPICGTNLKKHLETAQLPLLWPLSPSSANCFKTRKSANISCRLFPMRHAHSVWIPCSASLASTRASVSYTNP